MANLWSYGLLLVLALSWYGYQLAWGTEKALPMRRVSQSPVVDLRYLHEAAIPAHDSAADRGQFRAAVSKLEADLADFEEVMREVENGKVAVYRNLNRGGWESFVENKRRWISIDYSGKMGSLREFQIHGNGGSRSDFCIAEFGASGYVSKARVSVMTSNSTTQVGFEINGQHGGFSFAV